MTKFNCPYLPRHFFLDKHYFPLKERLVKHLNSMWSYEDVKEEDLEEIIGDVLIYLKPKVIE